MSPRSTLRDEGRTRAFLAALSSVTPKPVRVLVNTHHHGDHTHGNWLLPAAAVVGHELCRHEVLTTGSITKGLWPWVEWGEIEVWPPFVTFDDHLSVWVDDLEVSLQHIGPAHTTNDVVGWVADRSVLFTGDLVFNGGTPFVVMGSVAGSLESVERLRAFGAQTVVPGHGSVCGPEVFDQLARYFEFVQPSLATPRPPVRPPLDAALQTDLGEFSDWHDRERIVGNLHRAYAELDARCPALRSTWCRAHRHGRLQRRTAVALPRVISRHVRSTLPIDVGRTLAPLRHGRYDPTMRIGGTGVWRALRTPSGSATARFTGGGHDVFVDAWGAGAPWVVDRAADLVGANGSLDGFAPGDLVVGGAAPAEPGPARCSVALGAAAARRPRSSASGSRAYRRSRSWAAICRRFGERAPGPVDLLLPPAAESLAALPYYRFHPSGIERNRADTIRRCAFDASALERLVDSPAQLGARLRFIRGVGPWTAGLVLGGAAGDPTRSPSATSTSLASCASPSRATRPAATSACSSCSLRTPATAAVSPGCASPRARPPPATPPAKPSSRSPTSDARRGTGSSGHSCRLRTTNLEADTFPRK